MVHLITLSLSLKEFLHGSLSYSSGSQPGVPPKGHLTIPRDICSCHNLERGLEEGFLLASSGWSPGVLPNTL